MFQTNERLVVISIAEHPDVPLLTYLSKVANVLLIRPMGKQTIAKLDEEIGERLNISPSFQVRSLFGANNYIEVDKKQINSSGTEDLIRSFNPNCLITCGAPMLRKNIYKAAPLAVNVHWGIAPQFRGADSIFWAMYHRQWDCIGLTLHQIDDGADTGLHYAKARPELCYEDTEAALWAKLANLAPEMVGTFLSHLSRHTIKGVRPDNTIGRQYFYRDRVPEVEAELASRNGDGHPVPSMKHFEFYFEHSSETAYT